MSCLENLLEQHIKSCGLPSPAREYRFHPKRRWRFDFAWPVYKVAAEVDGGIYCRGRHVRGAGFERDAEKRNAAVMAGWRVLHFTPRLVKSGAAVQAIESLMRTCRQAMKRVKDKGIPEMRKAGGILRLQRAALCVDCEHISEATGYRCPRCGSASLLSLARVLNRKEGA